MIETRQELQIAITEYIQECELLHKHARSEYEYSRLYTSCEIRWELINQTLDELYRSRVKSCQPMEVAGIDA